MHRSIYYLTLGAMWLIAIPSYAQARLEPGEWERQITLQNQVFPKPQTFSLNVCYTKADSANYNDLKRWTLAMAGSNRTVKCKAVNPKQNGAEFSTTLQCEKDVRIELKHEFKGTTAKMYTENWESGKRIATNTTLLRKIADQCSAETRAQWEQANPGKKFVQ